MGICCLLLVQITKIYTRRKILATNVFKISETHQLFSLTQKMVKKKYSGNYDFYAVLCNNLELGTSLHFASEKPDCFTWLLLPLILKLSWAIVLCFSLQPLSAFSLIFSPVYVSDHFNNVFFLSKSSNTYF